MPVAVGSVRARSALRESALHTMTDNNDSSHGDASVTARHIVKHFLRREIKSMSVNEPLVHQGFDTEGVHQLRVGARRLRSELRALRDALPREPWTDVQTDLKWLGSTLGQLRDLEVMRQLFEDHTCEGTEIRDAIMTALERRREKRRRDVIEVLDSERYGRLVRRLVKLARHPGLGATGDVAASELFTPPLWDAACRYLDDIGDPYERRSDEALHHVRIASKKCRYNFEVAEMFLGAPARVVAEHLEEIQDILGRVHDRAVAVSFLDTLELPEDVDLDLRRTLRAEIGELRPQWIAHFEATRRGIIDVFQDSASFTPDDGRLLQE